MNFNINGHSAIMVIIVSFVTSMFLVPLVKIAAKHVGAIDLPNERKVHKVPMPRMGGLAIFGSFLLGYMLYAKSSAQMLSILIGSFVVILTGIFDDIRPIKARYKFILQILAACIVVFYGGIFLTEISAFGIFVRFDAPFNYIFSIIWIVSIMNAINLIDGIDGLAGGVSTIYFGTISIIAFLLNKSGNLDVNLALIMLGATLGFLVHNFPPAKIFMGDTGSLFLGFMISVIALLGFKATTLTSLIVPLAILAIPIFDTVLAIFRRLLKGESIGAPDKDHLHHQLLKMNLSTRITVIIIYIVNMLFAAVSIFYVLGDTSVAIAIYIALMLLLLFLVLKTDILFRHQKKDKKAKRKS